MYPKKLQEHRDHHPFVEGEHRNWRAHNAHCNKVTFLGCILINLVINSLFSNAGLIGGVLGMIFVAFITIHCMHVLVRAAQKMVARSVLLLFMLLLVSLGQKCC